jgi:hypothetical protein
LKRKQGDSQSFHPARHGFHSGFEFTNDSRAVIYLVFRNFHNCGDGDGFIIYTKKEKQYSSPRTQT